MCDLFAKSFAVCRSFGSARIFADFSVWLELKVHCGNQPTSHEHPWVTYQASHPLSCQNERLKVWYHGKYT